MLDRVFTKSEALSGQTEKWLGIHSMGVHLVDKMDVNQDLKRTFHYLNGRE